MAVESFLKRLEKYGEEQGYFKEMKLGELDKSCCPNSQTICIDFDKTKEIISNKNGFQPSKSSDGLKILPKNARIDFVEMKGWKEFLNWNKDVDTEEIKEKVTKFNLQTKLSDSLFILKNITLEEKFQLTSSEQNQYSTIPKHLILVVDIEDIPPIERIAFNLETLGSTSSKISFEILQQTDKELKSIRMSEMENTQAPIRLTCKTVDRYYENLA